MVSRKSYASSTSDFLYSSSSSRMSCRPSSFLVEFEERFWFISPLNLFSQICNSAAALLTALPTRYPRTAKNGRRPHMANVMLSEIDAHSARVAIICHRLDNPSMRASMFVERRGISFSRMFMISVVLVRSRNSMRTRPSWRSIFTCMAGMNPAPEGFATSSTYLTCADRTDPATMMAISVHIHIVSGECTAESKRISTILNPPAAHSARYWISMKMTKQAVFSFFMSHPQVQATLSITDTSNFSYGSYASPDFLTNAEALRFLSTASSSPGQGKSPKNAPLLRPGPELRRQTSRSSVSCKRL
mmetsp:Transcript_10811/g.26434  ORF Transcript_10811/g.26434 Transcript_10811/m.26434 type:complete len:303 (-) Transcript_10811:625-1533(-)